ncbi:MAG: cation-transporting P-type ATPase [Chromatiales bacterium]|jgi:magnesium-transporting ATPase (P-type)
MSDTTGLLFDFVVLEWLIAIFGVVILSLVGGWIGWRGRQELRELQQRAAAPRGPELWHALSVDETLAMLESSQQGLVSAAIAWRRDRYGPNRMPEAKPPSALVRFLTQFNNVLIYVLLAAAAVTALLTHWLDAGVILAVVVVNAIIGFIQEGKAEDALRAIRHMLSTHAMVLRNGRIVKVNATELVPGDVVSLQSGDKIPADLRLFRVKGLEVEEAALTGESVPVEKGINPVSHDAALADRRCMAYSGTLVTHGQGTGVVVATGTQTEIGRISILVAGVQQLTTPLLRQMAQFGRWLTVAILLLAMLGFVFGVVVRDYTAAEMFLASVGLAVAAIPEGLPAIMTITLAIGVQRMASRNAIIRRLPAVETLGTVGVICSDKTGTLTRNQMTVSTIVTTEHQVRVGGTGYDPHGSFLLDGEVYTPQENFPLLQALRAGLLCNDTALEQHDGVWRVYGDPMEGALLIAALKAGLEPDVVSKEYPRTDLIPFESGHKFMATLHHSHAGESFIFVKGAPEAVLERCSRQQTVDGYESLDRDLWDARVEKIADAGQRVLALALKLGGQHGSELTFTDVEDELVMLALFGLIDPPRKEAIKAVSVCTHAGIRVKMITGDHAATARAIAQQVGLQNAQDTLTGRELDAMDDLTLRRRVTQVDVYARVTPEHKLRLVQVLQEADLVVAMTGDGVNDAPALKRADVGVAMGVNGTEAAKEAAEMVLADDNFASIANAVEEGRTVYDNLKKAILFILPTNGGEAMVVLGAVLFGFHEFPLTPVQILWVNMITAVTLALALAFEPPESGVMERLPRNPREPALNAMSLWRIGYVSLILMGGTFGLFLWEMERGMSIEHARTVAVNTLVMFEIFYLFNSRSICAPILNRDGLLGNRYVLLAVGMLLLFQLSFTYLGPMQVLFGTTNINAVIWLRIVLVASSVLWLVELEKAVIRFRGRHRGN